MDCISIFESIYDIGPSNNSFPLDSARFLTFHESKAARLNLLQSGLYSDVTLTLEDGKIKAHRMLLASGSELMKAMLIGSWREAKSQEIRLTGKVHLFFTYLISQLTLNSILNRK